MTRDDLIDMILQAGSLEEIEEALEQYERWIEKNSEDLSMSLAAEQLMMMRANLMITDVEQYA